VSRSDSLNDGSHGAFSGRPGTVARR
jgi:hypothetical protein